MSATREQRETVESIVNTVDPKSHGTQTWLFPDEIAALRAVLQDAEEVDRLRAVLEGYRYCRHAVPDCICTVEARSALEGCAEEPSPSVLRDAGDRKANAHPAIPEGGPAEERE